MSATAFKPSTWTLRSQVLVSMLALQILIDGFAISAGDYLALTDGKLFGTDQKLETLLDQLAALAADKGA